MACIKRRRLAAGVAIFVFWALCGAGGWGGWPARAQSNEAKRIEMAGNLLVMRDFSAGTFKDAELDAAGRIVLRPAGAGQAPKTGIFVSPVIKTVPFTQCVISWNADTPKGTAVTVEARVQVSGVWSDWLSWGTWSTSAETGSASGRAKNLLVAIDADTLAIQGGQKAAALQLRVQLAGGSGGTSPAVRLLAAAIDGGPGGPDKSAANPQAGANAKTDRREVILAVPQYAQDLRDPAIASRICGPTSLAMVLNYYGIPVTPEEAAWGAKDYRADLFGNWSFNCAYAGSFGLDAYVAYFRSVEDIRREIQSGRPVIAAVRYKNRKDAPEDLPVLHNAPIAATDGHLVVVAGFTERDGKEYLVVNDPAAPDNQAVRRLYLAQEFERAWSKVAYVIAKRGTPLSPPRLPAMAVEGSSPETGGAAGQGKAAPAYREIHLVAEGRLIALKSELRSAIVITPQGKAEFPRLDSSTGGLIVRERYGGKGARLIAVAKNHRVYEAALP